MKKVMLFLLAVAMLFALLGCVAEAAPGTIPSTAGSSQDTEPTDGADFTEATNAMQVTKPLTAWESDVLRALIPAPPGRVMEYVKGGTYSREVWITDVLEEEVEQYGARLLRSGFDLYYYEESVVGYSLDAKNSEGTVIKIRLGNGMPADNKPNGAQLWVSVTSFWAQIQPPSDSILQSREPWGSNAYEALIPEPIPTCSGQEARDGSFVLQLDYSDYEDIVSYGQALLVHGFDLEVTIEENPLDDMYSFCAKNQEGYMVELSISGAGNGRVVTLILYEPGVDGWGRDWADDFYRVFIPEPEAANFGQWNLYPVGRKANTYAEFRFEGMDYDAVKAYAQALQDYGYTFNVSVQEDSEKQTYTFEAYGNVFGTVDSMFPKEEMRTCAVRLVFDRANTLEDGMPYCTLVLGRDAKFIPD